MIRPITRDDTPAVMALAEASGLFRSHELEEVGGGLADYDDGLVSVAYCAPEAMTDGTWNLLFIAVRPDLRGQGRGAALVSHVEQALRERGQRVLLVETSGTDALALTRTFYLNHGFDEEARIREYYRAGDDKVIYRKALAA